jgi:hypothetical protein
MSSGDIDDFLGPSAELERLIATHADLRQYLEWARANIEIVRAECPYTGGISTDLKVAFIDPRLNTILADTDIIRAPVTHEFTEGGLRKFCQIGIDYAEDPRGHRLANRAEYNVVMEILGPVFPGPTDDPWSIYDDFMDTQVRKIEKLPLTKVDPRLWLYPYESDPEMIRRIREAQQ